MRLLVATPLITGFTLSGRLTIAAARNEAESGSLALGSRRRHLQVADPQARVHRPPGPVHFARLVTHHALDRGYMVNEQFTWLIPFNQLEWTGLTWRTRARGGAERAEFDLV